MAQPADIVVIGAGPAGLALGCALADDGWSVTLVERSARSVLADPPPDGRDIALTHRARGLLEGLGIWQRFAPQEVAPIREARVVNGTSPFFLDFDPRGSDKGELGFLVGNHEIRRACYAAASERGRVEVIDGVTVTDVSTASGHATVSLSDGRQLLARLAVAADSRFSENRRRMGIGADMTDFGRTVIVARLEHERDHGGVAHECFHYGRTLALLPLNGRTVSAVVTIASDRAPALLGLSPDAYAGMVRDQFGGALGEMRLVGERYAYPLVGVYARRFVAERFALIGDAAVGMHPVTAHGYNFGLYGVDALARALRRGRPAAAAGAVAPAGDPGAADALARYDAEHRRVTLPIYLGTNALVRLFTDDRLPARALRAAVLRVADRLPPVKAGITRQLTGAPFGLPIFGPVR
jgi:ubiquinone biosynthesis UbiH/UbiF/VisC/COQ6 family hydroxylase